MKRVCAWCKKDMTPPEDYAADGAITHGICSCCSITFFDHDPRNIETLLDYIQEPVFVIDSEGKVRGTNSRGRQMLGKKIEDIENQLGGDAFECTYSKQDGGCGRTVHCKTCAIRNTVMDTLISGQGYQNVPAFQSIDTADGTSILKFLISTEKVNERILLRIDEVADITA